MRFNALFMLFRAVLCCFYALFMLFRAVLCCFYTLFMLFRAVLCCFLHWFHAVSCCFVLFFALVLCCFCAQNDDCCCVVGVWEDYCREEVKSESSMMLAVYSLRGESSVKK